MSTIDRFANRYFLVVDDEPFIRNLVARFLKQSGAAAVVEAVDGQAAIEAIGSYDMAFDAVVSDIKMRPMNGLELLSAIRTGTGGLKRNVPVLMLTAHAEAGLVADAMAFDADAFVVKPVGREALIERVARILERTIPIQAAAHYVAIGTGVAGASGGEIGTDGAAIKPYTLAPAPPTRSLEISIEALMAGPRPSQAGRTRRHADGRAADDTPLQPPAMKEVALGNVKENSILGKDIHFGDPSKLLVAAPIILTRAVLDRLKDLRQIHDSYSYLFVYEPRW